MLKATIETLDGLSDAIQALYKKGEDGKFHLQVEGMAPKSRVDEFRDNNIALAEEVKTLKATMEKYKDLDPDKYREMQTKLTELTDKQLIDEGQLEEVLAQRTERMRVNYEAQTASQQAAMEEAQARAETSNAQLSTLLIENEITKYASDKGVRAPAIPDVIHRGKGMFKLEDGKAMPYDSAGKPIYGKDGGAPLTIEEWMGGLVNDAPHLFEGSSGGGSGGSGKGTEKPGQISFSDGAAMNNNLEAIAAGTINVVD